MQVLTGKVADVVVAATMAAGVPAGQDTFRLLAGWISGQMTGDGHQQTAVARMLFQGLRQRHCLQIDSCLPLRSVALLPADQLLLMVCQQGSGSANGLRLEAGQMLLLSAGERLELVMPPDARLQLVRVPLASLQVSALRFGLFFKGGQYCPLPVVRSGDGGGCLAALVDDALRKGPGCFPEAVLDDYLRLCDYQLLQQWPGNLVSFQSHRVVVSPVLRQARSRMLEHLKSGLALEALARHCCVSVRTLYSLFRRELELTPGEYFRYLKLEFVFQELSQGQSRSVTDTAIDYGFTNLGRFARQYRQYIGELPSETLRRGLASAA